MSGDQGGGNKSRKRKQNRDELTKSKKWEKKRIWSWEEERRERPVAYGVFSTPGSHMSKMMN